MNLLMHGWWVLNQGLSLHCTRKIEYEHDHSTETTRWNYMATITPNTLRWISENDIFAIEKVFSPRKQVLGEERVLLKLIAVSGDSRMVHYDELTQRVLVINFYDPKSVVRVHEDCEGYWIWAWLNHLNIQAQNHPPHIYYIGSSSRKSYYYNIYQNPCQAKNAQNTKKSEKKCEWPKKYIV